VNAKRVASTYAGGPAVQGERHERRARPCAVAGA